MTYYKTPPIKLPELKARIEKVLGYIDSWDVGNKSVQFHTRDTTLKTLQALSDELGTDEINFDFGYEGCAGYSEWTPSSDGGPGYIEVMLANIKEPKE
jgi:hypothetical protein